MDKKLVRIVGRKDVPGKPIIYGTTKTFLELFNLNSLADLPTLREIQPPPAVEGSEAEFKDEVEVKAEVEEEVEVEVEDEVKAEAEVEEETEIKTEDEREIEESAFIGAPERNVAED